MISCQHQSRVKKKKAKYEVESPFDLLCTSPIHSCPFKKKSDKTELQNVSPLRVEQLKINSHKEILNIGPEKNPMVDSNDDDVFRWDAKISETILATLVSANKNNIFPLEILIFASFLYEEISTSKSHRPAIFAPVYWKNVEAC